VKTPRIRMTENQWMTLNAALAVAQVAVLDEAFKHHKQKVDDARDLLSDCIVIPQIPSKLGTFTIEDAKKIMGI
jgi:hypothetical protein